jgi:hypothetical protein
LTLSTFRAITATLSAACSLQVAHATFVLSKFNFPLGQRLTIGTYIYDWFI